MPRGVREKHEMIDRLEQLRAAVRTANLPSPLRADLELDIAEVERDILVPLPLPLPLPLPVAAGPLRQALRAWGLRLRDAGQPALAAVVEDAAADLERMGLRQGVSLSPEEGRRRAPGRGSPGAGVDPAQHPVPGLR